MTVEIFDATTTWTPPPGLASIDIVECWSKGFSGTANNVPAVARAGGMSGGYARTINFAVTFGLSYSVDIPGTTSSTTNFASGAVRADWDVVNCIGNDLVAGGTAGGAGVVGGDPGGNGGTAPGTDGGAGGTGGVSGLSDATNGLIPGGGGGGSNLTPGLVGGLGGGARIRITYASAPALTNPQPEPAYVPAERSVASISGSAIATPCGNPVEILIGFDYKRRNSNPIIFRNTLGTWPDLGNPAVQVTMYLQTRAAPIPVVGQVDIPAGSGAQVSFEVASELTATLIRSHHLGLYVKATMADGTYYPLVLAGLRICDPLEHDLAASWPVASQDREFLIGCDYLNANGNGVVVSNTAGTWPSLRGATVVLVLQGDGTPETVIGVVDAPFGVDARVHFDVPKSITSAHIGQTMTAAGIPCRSYVKAILATGDTVPLSAGNLRWRDPLESE